MSGARGPRPHPGGGGDRRLLAPRVVLFAGDLADRGQPDALDLGREILADPAAPHHRGAGKGITAFREIQAWVRRWGPPWFLRHGGVSI